MLVRGFREHDPREWTRLRAECVEAGVAFGYKDHHMGRAADRAAALEHVAKTNTGGRRVNEVEL